MVQWDTSEHDWLEGRGEKLYLIHMIDDATSELTACFARHDSTEENMRLRWSYLERHGRPVAFYTDKASLLLTTEKRLRDRPDVWVDPVHLPPTQIGRALRELGIGWIAAHWLKRAKDRVISQREAAKRMGVSDRWVRKLLQRMKREGDREASLNSFCPVNSFCSTSWLVRLRTPVRFLLRRGCPTIQVRAKTLLCAQTWTPEHQV
jgi:hypothetical protein